MYSTTMIKQLLDFNKKAFDNSFKAIVAFQERSEKMASVFWEKSLFFPQEGKKVIGDWVNTYKNGLDEFKTNVDRRFKLVEDYLLTSADQMESSFHTVVRQAKPDAPPDDRMTKKISVKKSVPRKPAVKKDKISRKKTNKQNKQD